MINMTATEMEWGLLPVSVSGVSCEYTVSHHRHHQVTVEVGI